MDTLDARTEAALRPDLRAAQRREISEYFVYTRLARSLQGNSNAEVLRRIAAGELEHARYWRRVTGRAYGPRRLFVLLYVLIARVFGLTFGLKLMERDERRVRAVYGRIASAIPDARRILEYQARKEAELLSLIREEKLEYVGSIVLGLNDALVELTGTLAGLTFALRNTRLIALTGLITGVAAALSMAASEYLSQKNREHGRPPLKSAVYTGVTYIVAVAALILPFLVGRDYRVCLALTMGAAVLLILLFTFYVAVARDLPFGRRFVEMTAISLGVAGISFGIGIVLRKAIVAGPD